MEVRRFERLTLAYRKTVTSRFSKGRNEVPRATPRLSVGRTYERDMGPARLRIGTSCRNHRRTTDAPPLAVMSMASSIRERGCALGLNGMIVSRCIGRVL
jgi:hypothetical protein